MNSKISLLAISALIFSSCALAQAPKAEDDHSAHHPPADTPAATAPKPGSKPAPEAFDRQMKAMQDMHQKMQAAKTATERANLMQEHMKLMQSGMAMMGQMGAMEGMHQQMERRMAMMEQMMQMMVDREATMTRK